MGWLVYIDIESCTSKGVVVGAGWILDCDQSLFCSKIRREKRKEERKTT